jgi:pimeloyl-ACP methyl ester carboxylesterase
VVPFEGPIRASAPVNNCGHWSPFEKPAAWTARVLAFLHGD